jgi:hypothetical protein
MDTSKTQLSTSERLQEKWLTHMEKLLDSGTITSTDMATLARVLLANGWSLDPKKLPSGLRDKLTRGMDPKAFDDDDEAVAGRIVGG